MQFNYSHSGLRIINRILNFCHLLSGGKNCVLWDGGYAQCVTEVQVGSNVNQSTL